MGYFLVLVSVFLSAFVITGLMQRYAVRLSLIDIPNTRSSHTIPTPRGGGVAIVVCFSAVLMLLYKGQMAQQQNLIESLVFGGGVIALTGLIDDHMGVKSWVRFCIHLFVGMIVVTRLPSLPALQLFGVELYFGWFGYLIYTLAIVWMLNLYNFMDGIDGIASAEAICVACSAAFILVVTGYPQESDLLVMLMLACLGFLIWNWPPARIFMGDVGSGYLGFVFAVFALYTSVLEGINIWTWIVLLSVFWVDATCTLLWRVCSGQNWGQAHRTHLYQIVSRKWKSHQKVTLAVIGINILWLFPWAVLTVQIPEWAFIFVIISVLPLVILVFTFGLEES